MGPLEFCELDKVGEFYVDFFFYAVDESVLASVLKPVSITWDYVLLA